MDEFDFISQGLNDYFDMMDQKNNTLVVLYLDNPCDKKSNEIVSYVLSELSPDELFVDDSANPRIFLSNHSYSVVGSKNVNAGINRMLSQGKIAWNEKDQSSVEELNESVETWRRKLALSAAWPILSSYQNYKESMYITDNKMVLNELEVVLSNEMGISSLTIEEKLLPAFSLWFQFHPSQKFGGCKR